MNLILKNIENGNLDLALKEIISYPLLNSNMKDNIERIRTDAVFELSRYNSIRSDFMKGLITKQDENESLNKIRHSTILLFELIKQIEGEDDNTNKKEVIEMKGIWQGKMSKNLSFKTPKFIFVNNDFGVGCLIFLDVNIGNWKWDHKNDRLTQTKWKQSNNNFEVSFYRGFLKFLILPINENKVELICIDASKISWIGIRGVFIKENIETIE